MKFFIPILALLAVTSTYASNKRADEANETNEANEEETDEYSYLGTNPLFPVKKECNNALGKFEETFETACHFRLNETDPVTEEMCKNIESEECKKQINISFADIPECKDSEASSLIGIQNTFEHDLITISVDCVRDENNNKCPFNEEINMKRKREHEEDPKELEKEMKEGFKIFKKVLSETCKSKKCTDFYLEFIEKSKKLNEDYQKAMESYTDEATRKELEKYLNNDSMINMYYNQSVDYLKSKECTSKHGTSNDASRISYSNSLFIAIGLLLFTLL